MRASALLLGVSVLVASACGTTAGRLTKSTAVSTHVPRTVRASSLERRRAATREAEKLLHRFPAPSGAVVVRGWPPDYGGARLAVPGGGPTGKFVDRHEFWVLHGGATSVASFVASHSPKGFRCFGCDSRGTHVFFASPVRGLATRILSVHVAQRRTRTIVRLDAQVVWGYPRFPKNVIQPA